MRLLDAALRIVRRVPDSDARRKVEGWVLISRADPILELRGLGPALEQVERGVEAGGRTAFIRALAHSQRAMLYGRSGDLDAADVHLRRALELRSALPPYNQWVLLNNRGALHMERRELAAARADLEQARSIAVANDLGVAAFKATHNLAYAEYFAGQLSRAVHLMRQARVDTAGITDDARLLALPDEARLLMECGLFDDADARLVEAAAAASRVRAGQSGAEILLTRGRLAYLKGDYAASRRLAHAARARFARRGALAHRDEADLLTAEIAMSEDRGIRRAARRAEEVAGRQAQERKDLSRRAALLAAEGLARLGEFDRAEHLFAVARTGRRALSVSQRLQVDLVQAQLRAAVGGLSAARPVLRRAAHDIAQAQAAVSSLDLRTAIAVHGRRLAELDVDLALREGSARDVLAASERWRAVSSRLAPVVASPDPTMAALTTELRLHKARMRGAPAEVRGELNAQMVRIENELRRHGWADGRAGDDPGTPENPRAELSLRRAASVLADRGRGSVSYLVHRGRMLAVGFGPDRRRPELVDLGRADTVQAVVRHVRADLRALALRPAHTAIEAAIRGSLRSGLAELDRILLAPLGAPRGALVIVPARTMVAVPWAMLPSRAGQPTTVAQSVATWVQRSAFRSAGRGGTAGTAGATDTTEGIGAADTVVALGGPDLEHADREALEVAQIWQDPGPARAVVSDRSTTAALADALRSSRVVHVAAHGRHNAQSPLFSSLRMADGELFAHELQQHGVGAEHVVLSACDVGESTVRPGEESLGLTASLLALGARCVVAPVTPVPDDVACALMTRYHRELVAGADAATALAVAGAEHELAGAFCAFGGDWSR